MESRIYNQTPHYQSEWPDWAISCVYSSGKYEEELRRSIIAYKYHFRPWVAWRFVCRLLPILDTLRLQKETDMLAYVPLSLGDAVFRGFNQTALLARLLGFLYGLPLVRGLTKLPSKHQATLSRNERLKNRRLVFGYNPKYTGECAWKRVILIDDVVATGATAAAIAEVLLAAGAKEVVLVALAHAV